MTTFSSLLKYLPNASEGLLIHLMLCLFTLIVLICYMTFFNTALDFMAVSLFIEYTKWFLKFLNFSTEVCN